MILFYSIATIVMIVALLYRRLTDCMVDAICLFVLVSFMSFWFNYFTIDSPINFYIAECFRSSLICFAMYAVITVKKEKPILYLIYSILLTMQTFVSLLQLILNVGGYTDVVYMLLSILELSLFIFGYSNFQGQRNGYDNHNCIDCSVSTCCSRLCYNQTN